MHILKVKFLELRTCQDGGRVDATVSLLTDAGTMNVQATAAGEYNDDRRSLIDALMQDVMRQVRFMPELRSGKTPVTLAQDALDQPLQQG
jgi:hypothetical protein